MRQNLRWVWIVVLIGLATLLWAWKVVGDTSTKPDPVKVQMAARGKVTYRIYCANCHGADAKGTGSLASILKVAPSDLTQLADRNEGKFDTEWVKRRVDGRDPMVAHGSGEMPVWGLSFQNPDRLESQEEEISAKLDNLVAFLETLQQP